LVALSEISLDLASLRRLYSRHDLAPVDLIREVFRRVRSAADCGAWTTVIPENEAVAEADRIGRSERDRLPLFGVPFSVKDNIHVAGLPTTAGCSAFAQVPDRSATVVSRLRAAGAILIGKNTMDQFATGLVGVRSPIHPVNAFDPMRIPGGSSSGSAVGVALGLVSFALGSDTGGSGRVPAALNNIVGFKPTPGVISTAGMIYANRSFDCVPVFALTCEDAADVFDALVGEDPDDPFLLDEPSARVSLANAEAQLTVGVPSAAHLEFDDDSSSACFDAALAHFRNAGARVTEVDFAPFLEAGAMVFGGPILAERYASVGEFISRHPEDVNPIVARIIQGAAQFGAVDLVRAQHRLRALQAATDRIMRGIDILVTPTVPMIPTVAEVEAAPLAVNARMGRYTYFGNPLGLCAIAVPASMRPDGLPFGICLYARKRADSALLRIAARFHRRANLTLGATGRRA
jgi:allophanate hydrolase